MNLANKLQFNKIEPFIFLLMCIIGILPLLFSKYYVTNDGPTHLYNANLIKELIFGNNPEISNLFFLNSFPVPNWSGHFIMALLNLILPAFLSEKIVFLLYFILTPVFFRKFVLHFYPENKTITYFIILFVQNHLLYWGLINMSIGIMFLFVASFYFVKYCKEIKIKNIIVLSLLLVSIYFSHAMIFLISLMILAATILLKVQTEQNENNTRILNVNELNNRIITLSIAALPGVILTIAYFVSTDSIEKGSRLDLSNLLSWIVHVRPLLRECYCGNWNWMAHILIALFGLLILGNIYIFIKRTFEFKNGQLNFKMPLKLSIVWFVIWFLFLLLP